MSIEHSAGIHSIFGMFMLTASKEFLSNSNSLVRGSASMLTGRVNVFMLGRQVEYLGFLCYMQVHKKIGRIAVFTKRSTARRMLL